MGLESTTLRPRKKRINTSSNQIQPYSKHLTNTQPRQYPAISQILNDPRGITISLEGNIGIGKTTFLQKLRTLGHIRTTTIREPLEQWTNNNHVNLLDRMYARPTKWSFIFQTLVMTNMLQNHIYAAKTKIMERSLGSAYNVFLRAQHDNRTMDHQATTVLQQWYHAATKLYKTTPDIIIYIRASPAVAFQRVRNRGRREERRITYEYLTQIHTLYDEWLFQKNTTTRVIVLNANQPPVNMLEDLNVQLTDI